MKHKTIKHLFDRFDAHEESQRRQIYMRLNLSHQRAIDKDNNPCLIITNDYNCNIANIELFMRAIENTKGLPYIKNQKGNNFIPTGRRLVIYNGIRHIKYWIGSRDPSLSYSPHVELFFETVLASGYPYEYSDSIVDYPYIHGMTLADFGNHLVQSLRTRLHSSNFRMKIMHQAENSYRQFSSSVNYIDYLLQRHSRLLHIRVDLSYDRNQIAGDESGLGFILDRFALFKKIMSRKTSPFDFLDGYIAHMEYGRKKGHHIHMSLFYYGQKRMKDKYIADQIRLVWLRVTNGIGLFQSTNLDDHKPVCDALGIIERGDVDKFNCLIYVIWYLVKGDQYLTYKYKERQRLFFRGEIPKQKHIVE